MLFDKKKNHIFYKHFGGYYLSFVYNHATTNLAIYSNEISQDKLSEALHRQSIILTQVHDKLHDNLFISTCSLHWNDASGRESVKKPMVKNSFIEKTYVLGTQWAIPMSTYNICIHMV